jgi:hypothetical protein
MGYPGRAARNRRPFGGCTVADKPARLPDESLLSIAASLRYRARKVRWPDNLFQGFFMATTSDKAAVNPSEMSALLSALTALKKKGG